MNIEPEFREKLSRIALIGESCGLVITPGVLTFYLGYGSLPLIMLESILIIAGFFTLVLALTDPFPKWADIKITWPVFLIFFIALPYVLTTAPRFPPLDSLAGISTILVSAVSSIYLGKTLYGFHRQASPKPALMYLVLCVLTITWTLYLWTGSPLFPTDEMTIDYYAAHLFLLGLNPYNPALTSNVFSYYGLAFNGLPVNQMLNVSTPILTGGFVTGFSYPALSILVFLPANILGISPSVTLAPFYIIPVIIILRIYHLKNDLKIAMIASLVLVLNPAYLLQITQGEPDVLWVIFVMLSLICARNPYLSGMFIGLAISVKQIPVFMIPFMIYFIYREYGRKNSALWIFSAIAAFLAVNLYFIASSPSFFVRALLAPEFQPIIGIGFGPSQISFLNIWPVNHGFFSLMVIAVLIVSLIFYVTFYRRIRYAFPAFQILIFLFNYRLLAGYLMFWPIVALVIPATMVNTNAHRDSRFSLRSSLKNIPAAKIAVAILCLAVLSVPFAYNYVTPQTTSIEVSNLSIVEISHDNVTSISLEVTVHSSKYSEIPLYFRITPSTSLIYMNGYLWTSQAHSNYTNGKTFNITITPVESGQGIPYSGYYRLIVYYGYNYGSASFELHSGKIVPS
ncbi:MAG: glycosyltransferase 87 family protein [Candidatus Thermoplasmatota archaeon]|nr:glycosyltransferase 87 family protein [Candidatus Thermoplasmatota archaeon]